MRAIIFDTETTGIDPLVDEVIELAWLEVAFMNGMLTRRASDSSYFGHTRPISFGAMGVHHILPEDLVGFPPFDAAPAADLYIGHKADFDTSMCKLGAVPTVDTLAIARKLWPAESHTLSAISYFIEGYDGQLGAVRNRLKNAHSAPADVDLCFRFLRFICPQHGITTLEQLQAFGEACRIPDYMAFGKFKGQHISKVDNGYRAWYKKQADCDPYLLKAFALHPY